MLEYSAMDSKKEEWKQEGEKQEQKKEGALRLEMVSQAEEIQKLIRVEYENFKANYAKLLKLLEG